MNIYFQDSYIVNLNLILTEKNRVKKLNKNIKIYSKIQTCHFCFKITNKKLGKFLYCIFFSIDTIENLLKSNNITIYDHFNHLLIHSVLHINGYDHKNLLQYNKMKKRRSKY